MSRLIGVDHGSRRIGLAVGEDATGLAFPRPALRRRGTDADLAALTELARSEGADGFVIGLPVRMDGTEGAQAEKARAFGERLAVASGLPVAYADERLTSWQAEEGRSGRALRAGRRSGEIDSAAAALILQEYFGAAGTPSRDRLSPSRKEPA